MPSASGAIAGPLTTIFQPPANCITAVPTYYEECFYASSSPLCYWPVASTCFPTGGLTFTGALDNGFGSISSSVPTVAQWIQFSPGVLPAGYQAATLQGLNQGRTTVWGCLSSWTAYENWCTTTLSGTYHSQNVNRTGDVTALLPQINIRWEQTDLAQFTPNSAPILPAASISAYQSSVSQSKTRATAMTRATSKIPKSTGSNSMTPTADSNSSGAQDLSSGAKAGIGVGVAIGVIMIAGLIVGCLLFRRKRKARQAAKGTGSDGPYVDRKAELDTTTAHSQVPLSPIMIGSKSQRSTAGRHELYGNFSGYETHSTRD